jgi:hypothetical protein
VYDAANSKLTISNLPITLVGTYNLMLKVKLTNYVTNPLYFPQETPFTVQVYNCLCTSSVFTQPTIATADYVNPPSLITAVSSGTTSSVMFFVGDSVGVTLTLFDI